MGCIQSQENIEAPGELSSLSRQSWIQWKNYYRRWLNYTCVPPYKETHTFFKYIGFLGDEISNNYLYFEKSRSEAKLKTLMFKFDVYFIFEEIRTKCANQSIHEYIISLKNVAEKAENVNNTTEDIVAEKILQDFKSMNIFERLRRMPLSSGIASYEHLSLHELMFLWQECERPTEIDQYLLNLEKRQSLTNRSRAKNACHYCGRNHMALRCYALGKECWRCGDDNHFASCCLKTYTFDCPNCGSNHAQKKCPAFAKECSRCKKKNHFSWKCFSHMIECCFFCGNSHLNQRQECPAKDNRCSNCRHMGHYSSLCQRRRYK